MFDKPRRWREESMSWTILQLLSEKSRLNRRQIRQEKERGQPHGLLKALVVSRKVKVATADLLQAGLIKRVPGIPLCFADYLFNQPAFALTDTGLRAYEQGGTLPSF